jgi:hypothetical protein
MNKKYTSNNNLNNLNNVYSPTYKSEMDEYHGLSYLNNKMNNNNLISPTRSDETNVSMVSENDKESNYNGVKMQKKKSMEKDGDFRAKYKTEICKFFMLNKECRYGNNVILK